MYLVHAGSTFGYETHDDRTFAARHKAKSHFGASRQNDRTGFGWLIVGPMIDFGCLICGAFIEMAMAKKESEKVKMDNLVMVMVMDK